MKEELRQPEQLEIPERKRMPSAVVHVYTEYLLQQSHPSLTKIAQALGHIAQKVRSTSGDEDIRKYTAEMRQGFQNALHTLLLLRTAKEIEAEQVTGGWELRFSPLPMTQAEFTVTPPQDGVYIFPPETYSPFKIAATHHLSHAMSPLAYARVLQDRGKMPALRDSLEIISDNYLCLRTTMKKLEMQETNHLTPDVSVQLGVKNGLIQPLANTSLI